MAAFQDVVGTALPIGIGATAAMDFFGLALERCFGVPPPDYRMVGRWFGHMAQGRLRHPSIATSRPLRRENLIGWVAHYVVGILFASALLSIWGTGWARDPSIAPALVVGLGSVAAPFFVMQPAMGLGFVASRSPRPRAARIRSLINHALFALGLYLSGWAMSWLANL